MSNFWTKNVKYGRNKTIDKGQLKIDNESMVGFRIA